MFNQFNNLLYYPCYCCVLLFNYSFYSLFCIFRPKWALDHALEAHQPRLIPRRLFIAILLLTNGDLLTDMIGNDRVKEDTNLMTGIFLLTIEDDQLTTHRSLQMTGPSLQWTEKSLVAVAEAQVMKTEGAVVAVNLEGDVAREALVLQMLVTDCI